MRSGRLTEPYGSIAPRQTLTMCLDYCPVTRERVMLYHGDSGEQADGYFLAYPSKPSARHRGGADCRGLRSLGPRAQR